MTLSSAYGHTCFITLALAFLGCAAPAQRQEDTSAASSARLIAAPLDGKNTWSVGICPTPLTTPDGSAPTGTEQGNCTKPGSCTGTLVAPNLVLTARHCVEGTPVTAGDLAALCTDEAKNHFDAKAPDITNLRVTTSNSVRVGTPVWRKAKAVYRPAGVNACTDDVALIELGATVPAAEAQPAAVDVFTDIATTKPASVAVVGRGVLDIQYDLDAGGFLKLDRGDYQRRILEKLPFVCASNTDGTCTLEDNNQGIPKAIIKLSKGVFVLGKGAGPGDSGAGILDQTRFSGGVPAVLGVFSYGQTLPDGAPGAGFAPRLAVHKAFLTQVATDAAKSGAYPVPAWVTAAPGLPPSPEGDAGTDGGESERDSGAGKPDAATPQGDAGTTSTPPSDGGGENDDGGCATAGTTTDARDAGIAGALALAVGAVVRRRRRRAYRA